MLRPVSMVNHGSLSIRMLPLVHFRHDTPLNIRLVVVSTKQEKKKHTYTHRKSNVRTHVRVSADDSRGHSMFTHIAEFTNDHHRFFSSSSSSFSFC